MMFTTLEIRLIGCLVAVLALVGIAAYLEHRGAAKCQMADAQVAAVQIAAAKAQEAVDASRVKDAEDALTAEITANAQLRSVLPTDHIVCLAPSSQRVPAAAKVRATQTATAGVLPPARAPDPVTFDPGPGLDQLFDQADDFVARCRELDAAVLH